ncbi:rhomboid family intramembrane serine protease [Mucilaginibacter sp. cycad4]|uniref:rhomboid family intramembrane serine protease n=1 Tax=Mucilaginibacter sp. cycad4 TaxID=3342096 RepID=UPI002AAB412F|nr:rhomboid family intramembrane serine protease [Mucilaginibacter gossypii]WPU99677.1 rhomboid family intramembrane serine protease [Mucilaginibacter gossypii]
MAFSFTPSFHKETDLDGLDQKRYLVIALETARHLQWKIIYTGKNGFIAMAGGGFLTPIQEFRLIIKEGAASITSKNADGKLNDWAELNQENVDTFIETFNQFKTSVTDDQVEEILAELAPIFESAEDDLLNAPLPSTKQNLLKFLGFFIPQKGYIITPLIIYINAAIFILMMICGVSFFEPSIKDLLSWGADYGPLTLNHEWWRLISSTFLHNGIFHLAMNMYALIYIGILLEPVLGNLKFAVAYILSGLVASLASVSFHGYAVGVGASGAIFGMYGVFLSLLTTNVIDKSVRKQLLVSIALFVGFNLLYGTKSGIDNAAHIGGLLSGFAIGYLYYPSITQPDKKGTELIVIMLIAVVTLGGSIVAYRMIPNVVGIYETKMKDFAIKESMALEVMSMPKDTSKELLLSELKDRGLYYWQENISLLNAVDSLPLPDVYKERDATLKRYCELRIKSYNLYYKQIEGKQAVSQSTIDSLNKEITDIIDGLNQSSK